MDIEISIAAAEIRLHSLKIGNDLLIDEIQFDGKEGLFRQQDGVSSQAGGAYQIRVGETNFNARISETNLNHLVRARLPADAPARNIQIALLSGKIRITGQLVKSVLSLPFTLEAVPRIDNGVRVYLDFQTAKLGIKLPNALVELVERVLVPSLTWDLSQTEVPVQLEEIRCEPGRLTARGRLRISLPPTKPPLSPSPFAVIDNKK